MMWNMGPGWGWSMVFGWFWMLLLFALIVWAVLRITEPRGGPGLSGFRGRAEPPGSGEPSAQEILAQRYARGELTDEQYEAMRRRLAPPASA